MANSAPSRSVIPVVINPLGIDPSDPLGQDDIVIYDPVLHLKVDEAVTFLLRSNDVLHNFTVPQFRVKMDFVPGQVSYIWAEPNEVGSYDLLCEELCGVGPLRNAWSRDRR